MSRSVFNHRRLRSLLSTDSFNRSPGSNILGSTDGVGTRDPLAWTLQLGNWNISGNKASCPGPAVGVHLATAGDLLTPNVELSIDLNTGGITHGLLFRYVDNSNYLFAGLNTSTSSIDIYKRVAGTNTQLATTAVSVVSFTLGIICTGSSLAAYRNGISVATATESFNATATKHGLYGDDQSIINPSAFSWDNWSASDA